MRMKKHLRLFKRLVDLTFSWISFFIFRKTFIKPRYQTWNSAFFVPEKSFSKWLKCILLSLYTVVSCGHTKPLTIAGSGACTSFCVSFAYLFSSHNSVLKLVVFPRVLFYFFFFFFAEVSRLLVELVLNFASLNFSCALPRGTSELKSGNTVR